MSDLPHPAEPMNVSRITTGGTQQEDRREAPGSPRYVLIDTQAHTVITVSSPDTKLRSVEVERKFRVLAEQWYMDTMPLSSYVEKILHPAYQKILVLGTDAVPLIMNELRDMPNDWFWALRIITEHDPVDPAVAGRLDLMAKAWLDWWEREGPTWRAQFS